MGRGKGPASTPQGGGTVLALPRPRRPPAAVALAALAAPAAAHAAASAVADPVGHVVVIYEENHSFDNLDGGWEGVRGRFPPPPRRTGGRSPRTARPTPAC